jgi:PAS domain S-box-containing protein
MVPFVKHTQHTVFIVDDDPSVVDALSEMLSRDGFDVITAADGIRACELLEKFLPCMLVVDAMLPGMDGFELCRRVKHNPRTAHLPVALVAQDAHSHGVLEGIAAGAVDYIRKPFDSDELRMRIRTQIRLHEVIEEQQRLDKHLTIISSAAKDAIITVDDEGKIAHWNRAAESMFGHASDAVLGRDLPALIYPTRFRSEQRLAFEAFQASRQAGAEGKALELIAIRKSGEEFPIELSLAAARVDDSWCAVGIVRDISERKRSEAALVQAKEQWERTFDAVPDMIAILDANHRVIRANQAMASRMGCSPEQAAERPCYEAVHGLSAPPPSCPHAKLLMSGKEERAQVADTAVAGVLDVSTTPLLDDKGKLIGSVHVARDISATKRAEEALRQSEEKYRSLFENSRDAIMILEPPSWSFTSGNPSTLAMFRANDLEHFTACGPGDLSPDLQPDGSASAPAAMQMIGRAMAEGSVEFEWQHRRLDGQEFPATVLLTRMGHAGKPFLQATVRDITEVKQAERALKANSAFLNTILNAIPVPIYYKNTDGRYLGTNKAFQEFFGGTREELLNKTVYDIADKPQADIYRTKDLELFQSPGLQVYDGQITDGRGVVHDVVFHKATFTGADGNVQGLIGAILDVTDRKRAEAELGHARKLETVGQLAAGIAHEINTPVQYVGDSVQFLKEAFEGHARLIDACRGALDRLGAIGGHEAIVEEIRQVETEVDLEYLKENVPGSFELCQEGIGRISTIVRAMKDFAHPDQRDKCAADLNLALQNTLTIARNEYKYVADVQTEFGEISAVHCHVGDLNQVFLNLIVNAAQAIGEVVGKTEARGSIRIATSQDNDWVRIAISDTGAGIPESIRHRIFDPFFTTKEVGKGSGQGLAIARSIIATRHGGELTFDSEVGKGTTFTILLPTDGRSLGHKTSAVRESVAPWSRR